MRSPRLFRRWRADDKNTGDEAPPDVDGKREEGEEASHTQDSPVLSLSPSPSRESRAGSQEPQVSLSTAPSPRHDGQGLNAAKEAALLTTMAAVASPSAAVARANRASEQEGEDASLRRPSLSSDPHLRNSAKDPSHYDWRGTLSGDLDDVGQLTVHVVGASGLRGADFGGKSDPFCVVRLGDVEFRSEVVPRTTEPHWGERFHFAVTDMTETLHLWVYDRDRFHDPEFLGRLAVPLLAMRARNCPESEEDSHGERVFALKDKKLDGRAKGRHPQIRLRFELTWNLPRACVKTIRTPDPKEPPAFKRSLLIGNVQRVRKLLHMAGAGSAYVQSCFNWDNPWRSIRALVSYELAVYYFEPFMLPLALLVFMLFVYPIYAADIVSDWLDPYYELALDEDEDDERVDEKGEKEKKSSGGLRYKAITEVTAFVQNSLGRLASTAERAKNVLTFADPFMSWIAVCALSAGTILLYLVPVRALLMVWGVHKFAKKLVRPDHVPTSELLNFLSRVPDDPTLAQCKPLSIMDENLMREEEEERARKEKKAQVAGKLAKKVSSFFGKNDIKSTPSASTTSVNAGAATTESSSTPLSTFSSKRPTIFSSAAREGSAVRAKIKEKAEKAKEEHLPPPFLSRDKPNRLSGFFGGRGSKEKAASFSNIPELVSKEEEEAKSDRGASESGRKGSLPEQEVDSQRLISSDDDSREEKKEKVQTPLQPPESGGGALHAALSAAAAASAATCADEKTPALPPPRRPPPPRPPPPVISTDDVEE